MKSAHKVSIGSCDPGTVNGGFAFSLVQVAQSRSARLGPFIRIKAGMPNPGSGLFDGDSPTQFNAKLKNTLKDNLIYAFDAEGDDKALKAVNLSDTVAEPYIRTRANMKVGFTCVGVAVYRISSSVAYCKKHTLSIADRFPIHHGRTILGGQC